MNWKDLTEVTMRVGLQQGTWRDLGSCFLAPIYSPLDLSAQFVITAYHVISEAYIKQEQILVLDSANKLIPASVECCSSPGAWNKGHDYAILRLNEPTSFKPIPCSKDTQPGPMIIRGRPEGLETEFAFVHGDFRGLERKKSEFYEVLDLSSSDFYNSRILKSEIEEEVTPHDVWRGMSGAPIVLCNADEPRELLYTIGVFTRLSSGGRAGRAYGVPMSVIERACNKKNLVIDLENPVRSEAVKEVNELIFSAQFGGMDDPVRERGLWDWISSLFYSGIETDKVLLRLLNFPERYGLDASDIALMHYFYGRLLLKRGRSVPGKRKLIEAAELANQASSIVRQRVNVLVQGRLAAENTSGDITKRIDDLLKALRDVEDMKGVPDKYIISELDSLLGRNATLLFLEAEKFNEQTKGRLDQLISEHESLLRNYPAQLAKQDVVNTLLQCLCLLWGVRPLGNIADELFRLSTLGFQQTERRKNSIFYTQMLCVKAIAYWLSGEYKRSLSILDFTGKVLSRGNITLGHEGVSEVYHYLRTALPKGASIIEMSVFNARISTLSEKIEALVQTGLTKQEAVEIELKANEWLEAVPEWHSIYKTSAILFEE